MTAPMDLTDDERRMWEYASKATTGEWYIAEYDGSIRSEVVGGNVEVGAHEFAGRDESHVLASCPVNVLAALQRLSDARAALRTIRSRHADMDHDVYCPGHKHDNGDCNCPDTDGLIHEGEPCVDGECECCLSVDVIAQALATPAPVAVPACGSISPLSSDAKCIRKKGHDGACTNLKEHAEYIEGIAPDPVQAPRMTFGARPPAAFAHEIGMSASEIVTSRAVQAAYAECARIARERARLIEQFYNHESGPEKTANLIADEIEAAALRAGVKP